MTLLTVMGADQGKKIMFFAETVGEVIAEACRKLVLSHLQPEQYMVRNVAPPELLYVKFLF